MPPNSARASFHQHPYFPPSGPEIPSRWHISCITSNFFFFSQWPLEWEKIKNSFFTKNQYLWDGILCQVGWIPLSRLLHVGQEAEGDLRWDVRTCHLIARLVIHRDTFLTQVVDKLNGTEWSRLFYHLTSEFHLPWWASLKWKVEPESLTPGEFWKDRNKEGTDRSVYVKKQSMILFASESGDRKEGIMW